MVRGREPRRARRGHAIVNQLSFGGVKRIVDANPNARGPRSKTASASGTGLSSFENAAVWAGTADGCGTLLRRPSI